MAQLTYMTFSTLAEARAFARGVQFGQEEKDVHIIEIERREHKLLGEAFVAVIGYRLWEEK